MSLFPYLRARQRSTTVAPTPQVRRVGNAIVAVSIVAILIATLLPEARQPQVSPFCLICGSNGGLDAILNFLLFLPLGVGLALSGVPARRAILVITICSALIEIAQLVFISGRSAALGDLITNSLGGAAGFAIGGNRSRWLRPSSTLAAKLAFSWAAFWIALQMAISYAFTPALPNSLYYGQIAHTFAEMATFRGDVLSAEIGGVPVPDSRVTDSRALRERLRNGANASVRVIPREPTSGVAPILGVADKYRRGILIVAQKGTDFVFGMRNQAAALRLRLSLFSIHDVFPANPISRDWIGDTLALSASYDRSAVTMQISGKSGRQLGRYSISPPLGWTLVSPIQWYVSGSPTEKVITLLWTAFLLSPLGYWAGRISSEKQTSIMILAALGLVLIVGFVFTPYLFGLEPVSLANWAAAVCGLAGGRLLERRLSLRIA